MGTPYFGHGYLEWKKVQGSIIPQYTLPWEHAQHQPHIKGGATFTEDGQEVKVSYEIVYLPAGAEMTHTLTSDDGQIEATVELAGSQEHDFYVALVQGYPPPELSGAPEGHVFAIDYHLTAIRIPQEAEVQAATPTAEWKFDGSAPLPAAVRDKLTIRLSNREGKKIYRWKQSEPEAWVEMTASALNDLEQLGAFAVPSAAPW